MSPKCGFLNRMTATTVLGVTAAAVVGLTLRHMHLKYWHSAGSGSGGASVSKTSCLPPGVTWCDQSSYDVLVAICDTLIPSLSLSECSDEEIIKAFQAMGVEDVPQDSGVSVANIAHARAYLCSGAVECGTPRHVAEAVQKLISPPDQELLYLVLRALSTTLGSLLLTGYPLPFHQLSRNLREHVLFSFAQSDMETFRGLFSVRQFSASFATALSFTFQLPQYFFFVVLTIAFVLPLSSITLRYAAAQAPGGQFVLVFRGER